MSGRTFFLSFLGRASVALSLAATVLVAESASAQWRPGGGGGGPGGGGFGGGSRRCEAGASDFFQRSLGEDSRTAQRHAQNYCAQGLDENCLQRANRVIYDNVSGKSKAARRATNYCEDRGEARCLENNADHYRRTTRWSGDDIIDRSINECLRGGGGHTPPGGGGGGGWPPPGGGGGGGPRPPNPPPPNPPPNPPTPPRPPPPPPPVLDRTMCAGRFLVVGRDGTTTATVSISSDANGNLSATFAPENQGPFAMNGTCQPQDRTVAGAVFTTHQGFQVNATFMILSPSDRRIQGNAPSISGFDVFNGNAQ